MRNARRTKMRNIFDFIFLFTIPIILPYSLEASLRRQKDRMCVRLNPIVSRILFPFSSPYKKRGLSGAIFIGYFYIAAVIFITTIACVKLSPNWNLLDLWFAYIAAGFLGTTGVEVFLFVKKNSDNIGTIVKICALLLLLFGLGCFQAVPS